MEKASPLREGEKKLLRLLCHNFLSAYSDNITNSSVRACVCVYGSKAESEREPAHERERVRERERAGKWEAPYSFTYPPPPTPLPNHRREGPDPKLPIKSARGSRHYLSNKLLTDYMSRSLVHD